MAKENEAGLSDEQVALLEGEGIDMDSIVSDAVSETEAPNEETKGAIEDARSGNTEEVTAEEAAGNAAGQAPAGYVPNAALREARDELKNTREQLRQMQGWQAEIAQKLAEQRSQAEPAAPEIPNAETDPVESIAWTQKQVQEMQQAQMEREQQWQQQYQQQQQTQAVFNEANTEFLQASQSDPDLQAAYDHARASYAQEVQMLGTPPAQVQQALDNFAIGFATNYVNNAKRNGVTITDYVKSIAKARGWQPASSEQNKAEETIERQAKAQSAAQTLSKSGTGSGETTLQDLAGMSGEELEAFALQNPELFARLGSQ
jgi:hypothetical protein